MEKFFTTDKSIDDLLLLVGIEWSAGEEVRWKGEGSPHTALYVLYNNYKAMSLILEALHLPRTAVHRAAKRYRYLGGKELSAEEVLEFFNWSTSLYYKKDGAFSFAFNIAADEYVLQLPAGKHGLEWVRISDVSSETSKKQDYEAYRWFCSIKELFKPGGWIDLQKPPNNQSPWFLERCAAEVSQRILVDKKKRIRAMGSKNTTYA